MNYIKFFESFKLDSFIEEYWKVDPFDFRYIILSILDDIQTTNSELIFGFRYPVSDDSNVISINDNKDYDIYRLCKDITALSINGYDESQYPTIIKDLVGGKGFKVLFYIRVLSNMDNMDSLKEAFDRKFEYLEIPYVTGEIVEPGIDFVDYGNYKNGINLYLK